MVFNEIVFWERQLIEVVYKVKIIFLIRANFEPKIKSLIVSKKK